MRIRKLLVFILMAVKNIATLFGIMSPGLVSLSSISLPMLLIWSTNNFLDFKSLFLLVSFCLYVLLWLVIPWLIISDRRTTSFVGAVFIVGMNIFDIISCMLCSISLVQKVVNVVFSLLIICVSMLLIRRNCKTA